MIHARDWINYVHHTPIHDDDSITQPNHSSTYPPQSSSYVDHTMLQRFGSSPRKVERGID